MAKQAQTVLPFRVEATDELLTANAGLALFGEFVRGLGLERWLRRIGVIHAWLDAPAERQRSYDGIFLFRGRSVVLLSGPATVELAVPFHVEALPATARNYWQDLRAPRAQFDLPFSHE